jgi:hypothetical protein
MATEWHFRDFGISYDHQLREYRAILYGWCLPGRVWVATIPVPESVYINDDLRRDVVRIELMELIKAKQDGVHP